MAELRLANRNTNPIFFALVVVALAVAVWIIRNILLLVFAAVILVVFFTMPIRLLSRWGIRRTPAIFITLIGLIVVIALLARLVFPSLFDEFSVLITVEIPKGIERLVQWWNSGEMYRQFPFLESIFGPVSESLHINPDAVPTILNQITGALGQLGTSVLPVLGGVANTALSIVIVLFLSLYLLSEPKVYEDGIVKLFPKWYRHRVREIMSRIDFTLREWLKVTGISMIIVGVGTSIGLAIIGIEQWLALGVLAGVLSFIPNFGPITALIPSVAVGIIQAPENLGWIIVVIYGVSFVQSQLISPLLVSESLSMPPVMVLMGQIVSGIFLGFMGIMLAVPLTAIMMILVQEVYVKDILGDRGEEKEIVADDGELVPDGT